MKFIVDGFSWFVNLLKEVWHFFQSFIDNTLLLFKYIGKISSMAYTFIDSLPSVIKVFGLLTISVSVIYIIVGRNVGSSD